MINSKDNRPSVSHEIHLRRMTIDEASNKLDKYLNDAFMSNNTWARVIHGKGTGILRNAIHKQLCSHPLIKSYRLGIRGEGGEGVTIVELVNR
jgi:DNA mismatch repair protein MutS2